MHVTAVDEMPAAAKQPATQSHKSRTRQVLQIGMSVVLVVAVVWYVKKNVAGFSDGWAPIRGVTWLEIGVLLGFAIWEPAAYLVPTVIGAPGLTSPQALVQTEPTPAVANTVPAGGAIAIGLTYGMYGSWGFSKSRTSLSVVVS